MTTGMEATTEPAARDEHRDEKTTDGYMYVKQSKGAVHNSVKVS